MARRSFIFILLALGACLCIPTSGFGQGYDRAGWEADLSTLYHGVNGTVRIVDQNTLEVENFYFEGVGFSVYFYLAQEDTQSSYIAGLPVGPQLVGQTHVNESLTIDLPPDVTLDGYNAISVWCVDARANFGSGTFGPVAEYDVTFDATWSSATHQPFPADANFSGLVGATHKAETSFWEVGQTASFGIEDLAELGIPSTLAHEFQNAINASDAYSRISGSNIDPSPGSASTVFKVHALHPNVTLVSKITPSPDWFVGVSGLPLYQDGEWRREVVVDLYPYDAGTDSGADFDSPDQNIFPPEPITQITGFPFENAAPLGTFTFRLHCEHPPVGDLNGDCRVDFVDLALMMSNWLVDCAVTPGHPACQ